MLIRKIALSCLAAVLAMSALAERADAFYSSAKGRFISRDPIEEEGFVLVRSTHNTDQADSEAERKSDAAYRLAGEHGTEALSSEGMNPYCFVRNEAVAGIDVLGLDRWVGGTVHQYVIYEYKGGCYRVEIGAWRDFSSLCCAWQSVGNLCLSATVGGFGVVTKTKVACPARAPDLVTGEDMDAKLHQKYKNGDLVYYELWIRNCNHFAATAQHVGTGHGVGGGGPVKPRGPGPISGGISEDVWERTLFCPN